MSARRDRTLEAIARAALRHRGRTDASAQRTPARTPAEKAAAKARREHDEQARRDGLAARFRAWHLPVPTFEYRFHPTRLWRFDLAWVEHRVAVEIDGGIWMRGGGAHSRPRNILRDMEKTREAALAGWTVLRFTPSAVRTGALFRDVATALAGSRAIVGPSACPDAPPPRPAPPSGTRPASDTCPPPPR